MLLQASGGIANSGVYVAVLPRMQQGRVFDATLPTTTQSQTMLSWAAASAEATGTSINGSNSMLGPSISPLLLGLESPSGISLDLASRYGVPYYYVYSYLCMHSIDGTFNVIIYLSCTCIAL